MVLKASVSSTPTGWDHLRTDIRPASVLLLIKSGMSVYLCVFLYLCLCVCLCLSLLVCVPKGAVTVCL